jgi:hypothetical protein
MASQCGPARNGRPSDRIREATQSAPPAWICFAATLLAMAQPGRNTSKKARDRSRAFAFSDAEWT